MATMLPDDASGHGNEVHDAGGMVHRRNRQEHETSFTSEWVSWIEF